MVNVPRLVDAVEKLAWRHGCTHGDEVTYMARADGSHVITIVVPAGLVDPESLPKKTEPAGKLSWGMVTPDIGKGSVK